MKNMMLIVGILLIAVGTVWFLQGIGVIGGSFMTDQGEWIVIGLITALAGGAVVYFSRRMNAPTAE